MNKAMMSWFGLILMLTMLMGGMSFVPQYIAASQNVGIVRSQEKTMLDVDNEYTYVETYSYGDDLLLMLTMCDVNTPDPKSIRINNTPIVDITPSWINEKAYNIQLMYNSGAWNLSSLVGKKIIEVKYEYNGGDPYIHYVTE